MIICPYCSHENIEGADICEQCQQPLDDLSLPTPQTEVERSLLKDHVALLHPRTPLVVSPETPVGDVLDLLVAESVGCVVIVEDQRPIGVFSERDVLLKLNVDNDDFRKHPVSDYMTPDPDALQASAKIAFAVQRMDLGGFRHVPIVDSDGKLVGIISARDILRYLTEKMTTSNAV